MANRGLRVAQHDGAQIRLLQPVRYAAFEDAALPLAQQVAEAIGGFVATPLPVMTSTVLWPAACARRGRCEARRGRRAGAAHADRCGRLTSTLPEAIWRALRRSNSASGAAVTFGGAGTTGRSRWCAATCEGRAAALLSGEVARLSSSADASRTAVTRGLALTGSRARVACFQSFASSSVTARPPPGGLRPALLIAGPSQGNLVPPRRAPACHWERAR